MTASVALGIFLLVMDAGTTKGPPQNLDAGTGADAESPESGIPQPVDALPVPVVVQSEPAPPLAPSSVATRLVRGRLFTKGTRTPLVAARVGLGPLSETATDSGDDGAFQLEVPAQAKRLFIQCPGHESATVDIDFNNEMVIRLLPRTSGERFTTVVLAEPEQAPSIPLEKEEIQKTAGSMGDPFRVVESLPGVVQAIWPMPLYAIRGANPGNTGYFIDGVRAPALFHFALGPSVVHPYFLEQIEFFPGGYPIDHGRYVSGIVTAKTATPATDALHMSADIRLFDAGGIVATPFDNGRGTVAVAGRYSYTGYLLSAFSSAYALDYWDYQARADYRLGPGKLTFFAFGSGDSLRQKDPDTVNWGPGITQTIPPGIAEVRFHRAQLRWDGRWLAGRWSAAMVVGTDESKTSLTSVFTMPIGSRMAIVAPRLMADWSLWRWLDVNAGVDGELQWIKPERLKSTADTGLVDNYQTDLFADRSPVSLGAFAGLTARPFKGLVLVPGVRYDWYWEEGTRVAAASPRLSARWQATPLVMLKTTVGQYNQLPSLPLGVPGFESFGLKSYGLQRSRQVSFGVESKVLGLLGLDLQTDVTGFYQRLRLSDMRSTLLPDPQAKDLLETRPAESYGIEVLIRRPSKHRLHGWLAYTLAYSNRLVDGVVAPSDWDQRHILNLVLACRLPRDYSVSTRFHYNTGRPFPLFDTRSEFVAYSRLPSFPQLDLRGDKRFRFETFVMDVYLELINSTLSREVYDRRREQNGEITENAYRLVLPSAGVHVEW